MKWNESSFRPPLCTYRLNWARRTSWGWRDDWDDTVLQTQDSKFEPWRSEAEHATSRSRRLPQYWLSHVDGQETFFVSFKPPRPGTEPRTLAWKAAVLTTTLGPPPQFTWWSYGQPGQQYLFCAQIILIKFFKFHKLKYCLLKIKIKWLPKKIYLMKNIFRMKNFNGFNDSEICYINYPSGAEHIIVYIQFSLLASNIFKFQSVISSNPSLWDNLLWIVT